MFSRYLSVFGLIGAVSMGVLTGCGDDKPADPQPTAGVGGAPSIGSVDNPGDPRAGTSGAAGAAAGSSAAGTGVAAGAAAGSGGSGGAAGAAAGSGGSGGATGAAAGSGGAGGAAGDAGGAGAAGADPNDPFAGLFGDACDGFLCLEDADCAALYPDDAMTCKFTKCVDFACQ